MVGKRTFRKRLALESFKRAEESLPDEITPDLSFFGVTRGQFSMLDIIRVVLSKVGRSKFSVWCWVIAEHDMKVLQQLKDQGLISGALLIISSKTKTGQFDFAERWRASFGPDSVKYIINHSKMVTIEAEKSGMRILIHGSMNLNYNPRYENFQIEVNHPGFDLVKQLEAEIPVLPDEHTYADAVRAGGMQPWAPMQNIPVILPEKVWEK